MDIALGYYGQTPADVDPEVRKIAAQKTGKDPITCRPADLIAPEMETLRKQLKEAGLPDDDENCVIWAMFPQELKKHYDSKKQPAAEAVASVSSAPAKAAAPAAAKADASAPAAASAAPTGDVRELNLTINGKNYSAKVERL
jgi:oxaloacetate decarboxylase alpha subunit/pyruvate carboxylase subunit B